MGRICVFPNCSSKMTRWTPRSFHRLPLRNRDLLKLWLVALQIDVNTPVRTLRLADLRVCSDHFDRDDYCQSNRKRRPTPKHFFLKKTAVPRAERPAAVTVEVQYDSSAETDRKSERFRSTGVQVSLPETRPVTTHRSDPQHIVDEEAILQLMKSCPECNRKCRCSKHTRGPYFIVYQSCYFCDYQRKWARASPRPEI
ncbi:uncharacterized protein AKAME5_000273700 [Lates japonicus]|uniref:THAP domain-containing protein 1 n=1 Tax=Lates japonicus TaxID=270547 RepID=A0AAD3M731_LATJO|nr:uncharacterized protein AKAME5_000273700 [Lates japonicus]